MSSSRYIGPDLPPHLRRDLEHEEGSDDECDQPIGPCPPPRSSESSGGSRSTEKRETEDKDEEDDLIGPYIPGDKRAELREYQAACESGPSRLEGENSAREEWMLTPGEDKSELTPLVALRPKTKFDQRAKPEKGSKNNESSKRTHDAANEEHEREKKLKRLVDDYNDVKRSKTLAKLHKETSEKTKNSSNPSKRPERVMFDPEKDLSVRIMSEAQRKSVMTKAAELNSRFGQGTSKFL